jgi:hypothetical protein
MYTFFDPVVIEDRISFDYASSEESVRHIAVKFEDYNRAFFANGKEKRVGPLKKKYQWKMHLKDGPAINVQIGERPNLNIEETEINFLNAKMFIPGKAKWQSLSITLPHAHQKSGLLAALLNKEPNLEVHLDLYTMDGSTKLETWVLKNVWLRDSGKKDEARPRISVRFDNVEYVII